MMIFSSTHELCSPRMMVSKVTMKEPTAHRFKILLYSLSSVSPFVQPRALLRKNQVALLGVMAALESIGWRQCSSR